MTTGMDQHMVDRPPPEQSYLVRYSLLISLRVSSFLISPSNFMILASSLVFMTKWRGPWVTQYRNPSENFLNNQFNIEKKLKATHSMSKSSARTPSFQSSLREISRILSLFRIEFIAPMWPTFTLIVRTGYRTTSALVLRIFANNVIDTPVDSQKPTKQCMQ